jgi:hypothetical protein
VIVSLISLALGLVSLVLGLMSLISGYIGHRSVGILVTVKEQVVTTNIVI